MLQARNIAVAICAVSVVLWLPRPAIANDLVPLTAECMRHAAKAFGHDLRVLALILETEGGRVGQCTTNTNGTVDCGPAQVNSSNVPAIAAALGLPRYTTLRRLRDDGCFNVIAGAWILRQAIDSAGGDIFEGMGRYNSSNPVYKARYQLRLVSTLRGLVKRVPNLDKGVAGQDH
jgi:hypothetical protein